MKDYETPLSKEEMEGLFDSLDETEESPSNMVNTEDIFNTLEEDPIKDDLVQGIIDEEIEEDGKLSNDKVKDTVYDSLPKNIQDIIQTELEEQEKSKNTALDTEGKTALDYEIPVLQEKNPTAGIGSDTFSKPIDISKYKEKVEYSPEVNREEPEEVVDMDNNTEENISDTTTSEPDETSENVISDTEDINPEIDNIDILDTEGSVLDYDIPSDDTEEVKENTETEYKPEEVIPDQADGNGVDEDGPYKGLDEISDARKEFLEKMNLMDAPDRVKKYFQPTHREYKVYVRGQGQQILPIGTLISPDGKQAYNPETREVFDIYEQDSEFSDNKGSAFYRSMPKLDLNQRSNFSLFDSIAKGV